MNSPRRLRAVVFDFDGVLVDTEPIHWQAFRRVVGEVGIDLSWSTYQQQYMGFDDRDAFSAIFSDAGRRLRPEDLSALIHEKARIFQELAAEGVSLYPGVLQLICRLRADVPLALCSGALRTDVEPILEKFGLKDAFVVWVTAEDVPVSKPDPAPYVEVLRRLAAQFPQNLITPPACVAIEDTPAGVAAAKRAGLKVLAVAHTHETASLQEADRIAESLEMVSPADLEAMVAP